MLKKWFLFGLAALWCGIQTVQATTYTWNPPDDAGYSYWDGTKWAPVGGPGTTDIVIIPFGRAILDDGGGVIDNDLNYYPRRTYAINSTRITLSGGTLDGRQYVTDGNNFHLRIGPGTDIVQTAGVFTVKSVTFSPGVGNVSYTMSGGTYSSDFTTLGYGAGSTATMTISGAAYSLGRDYLPGNAPSDTSTTWVNPNGGNFIVGENYSNATLNITGGFVNAGVGAFFDPEESHTNVPTSEFILGGNYGTGTMNLSGGYVRSTNYYVGLGMNLDSNGIANYTGGRHDAGVMMVGSFGSTGTVSISDGGYLRVLDTASIGERYGNGLVNQTGGMFLLKPYDTIDPDPVHLPKPPVVINDIGDEPPILPRAFSRYGLIIGDSLNQFYPEGGKGIYNISGGTLESHYSTFIGLVADDITCRNALAQLNISGNADVKILASALTGHVGNLVISAGEDIDISGFADNHLSRAEVNLIGGNVYVDGAVYGESYKGSLNIFGSKAAMEVGAIKANGDIQTGPSGWKTNFLLDVDGSTTIFVNPNGNSSEATGVADLRNGLTVQQPAFLSLKTNTVDLVSALNGVIGPSQVVDDQTSFGFTELRPVENGREIVRLTILDNDPDWNLQGNYVVNGDDGLEKGSLYVDGKYTYLRVKFKGILDSGMADLLMKYLNDSLVDTGVEFGRWYCGSDSLLLTGDYLNLVDGDLGYAWFGWDLSGFNEANSSDITLLEFGEVPEPATWVMLMLGGAGMLGMRVVRRRNS